MVYTYTLKKYLLQTYKKSKQYKKNNTQLAFDLRNLTCWGIAIEIDSIDEIIDFYNEFNKQLPSIDVVINDVLLNNGIGNDVKLTNNNGGNKWWFIFNEKTGYKLYFATYMFNDCLLTIKLKDIVELMKKYYLNGELIWGQ